MTFWRQFKVLTWKNTLLRRRHIATWLVEVAVPVILTLGMVGIYGTIRQKVQPASIPAVAYTTAFDEYYRNFGKAVCHDLYDATVFWRCNIEDCDPKKCEYLALAVAPYTSADAGAVATARALHAHINTRVNGSLSAKLFASNDELNHYIMRPDYPDSTTQQRIGAAVVFESGPPNVKYHMRFNKTVNSAFQYLLPPTDLTTDPLLRDGGESPKACGKLCWQTYLNMYFYSGALAVQNLVDEFIVSDAVGERVQLRSNVVEFPTPSFKSAGFWGSIASFYGVFMVIAILYPVSNIVRSLVVEKELKIREGMKMMSLRDSALYASWVFHHATTFTIIAVLILATGGKLFQHSNGLLILLYYLLFFYSTTAFAFFMSTFFSRSRTAAVLGILPYFAGYFITLALKDDAPRQQKLLACLHPSSAFTLAMQAFIDWEDSGIGVTRYTWRTSPSGNAFTFADALGMMLIDIFVYVVLTWYNDKVWPSEFGTRLPPWFFLTHAYWKRVFPKCYQHGRREMPTDVEEALASELTPDVERVPDSVAQQIMEGSCVYIRRLRKEFDTNTGKKVAVDDLNLTMYAGQITALLGPNGAGKTTTVSLLTGLLQPTSGTALIAGKDIYTDMSEIRQQLGVCPQHDVLFPELTVEEHLILYASLKGVPRAGLAAAAEQMIAEVGLMDKRKVPAKKLSGGMRRKLSVAIAFIGDPKVVFLDEPTTGMDPYSRRSTWTLIRKYREGRVIIFSTHFMDEADVLADRIAIMSKGGLRACGTSLFLKNHFNCGYTLVVERDPHADVTRIERFVCSRVPEAKVVSSVGAEIAFQLPLSASPAFKALFDDMDARQETFGIITYGMSVTTLEQVFLKIARGEDRELVERMPSKASIDLHRKALSHHSTGDSLRVASYDGLDEEGKFVDVELCDTAQTSIGQAEKAVTGGPGTPPKPIGVDHLDNWRFFRRHMQALLIKRMLYFSRDRKAWVFQFIMPALFVLLGSALMKAGTKNNILDGRQPLLPLTLGAYNPGITHFPNPIYYSRPGTLFDQAVAASPAQYSTSSWAQNANVTGQQSIMEAIPSYKDLPGTPVDAPGVHNMSEQLLRTRANWRASRYGAFSFANISHDAGQHTYEYNVHVNYTGVHAAPIYTSIVNSAILRDLLPSASINAVMGRLPATKLEHSTAASFEGFPTVILIMLAFCFIPAAFAVFVVRERETKAKHLQIVSGVTYVAYWLSTWLFDFLSYQIPLWLTVLILVCFDAKALIQGDAFAATVLLFLLWGASATSFTYLTSFLFTRHSMAQVSAIFLNFVTGLILVIITVIMTFVETTRPLVYKLVFLFRLTPSFCLGNGLINVIFAPLWGMVDGEKYTVWSLKISGWNLIYMAIEAVGFFLLTLAVEHLSRKPFFANCRQSMGGQLSGSPLMDVPDDDKDVDVLKEEQRVKNSHDGQDVVVLKGLHKIYPGGKAAVQALSLGIPKAECFGLLGVNGAGKTTTLSILTGEFPPSAGDVILGGLNITENPGVVRRLVGYCPQFDALFDLLTGREHLQLYARVKGLDEGQVKMVVDSKIGEMDLSEYANRIASTYSGGNKRKLSVAMAMIGRPLIVFLDEPSSGMDPVARRFMWQVISDITTKRGECCVILTTHSMEEAEALCTRVGIMVDGRLRCLGSTQHIKSRHGLGYQVELSVQLPSPADISKATEQLASMGDDGRLSHGNVNKALDLLGHGDWSTRISAHGSGADVWHTLSGSSGVIAARDLASWCVLEERVDAVQTFVEQRFPGAVLRERQGNKVRYGVPLRGVDEQTRRLSDMFGDIEAAKHTLHAADYSVSQTSLEQIFNLLAAQREEHHDR